MFSQNGISDCVFKQLISAASNKFVVQDVHHHTGFEIHLVVSGYQEYFIENKIHRINAGEFIAIYPFTPHKVSGEAEYKKFAISFNYDCGLSKGYFSGKISERIKSNMEFIAAEFVLKNRGAFLALENAVFEVALLLLRNLNLEVGINNKRLENNENAVLAIAKKYISDNIERNLSVNEIADYCHLSRRQLGRIFNLFEKISPGEYIKSQRVKQIEYHLSSGKLSVREISEKMNFSSEYYLNSFFKQNTGLPPGKYRALYGKK